MEQITVFGTVNCMQCKMVGKIMDREGIDYKYINIDEDQEAREKLSLFGFKSVPVTMVERPGEPADFIQGFRPDEIKKFKK